MVLKEKIFLLLSSDPKNSVLVFLPSYFRNNYSKLQEVGLRSLKCLDDGDYKKYFPQPILTTDDIYEKGGLDTCFIRDDEGLYYFSEDLGGFSFSDPDEVYNRVIELDDGESSRLRFKYYGSSGLESKIRA